jgi:hypothetical protein
MGPVTPRAILTNILGSHFMILLDNLVLFTGLPSIQQGLGLSPVALSWVRSSSSPG